MPDLQTGQDKIQKISDLLKEETLQPAKQKAKEIIENAHIEAKKILEEAHKKIEKMHEKAEEEIEQKKKVFESSLKIAGSQIIDQIKIKIENQIFDQNLYHQLKKSVNDPKVMTHLMQVVIESIQKEGLDTDLSVIVSKEIPSKKILENLEARFCEMLKEKDLRVGDFEGGIKIQLIDEEITLDISIETLKEMVASYTRGEFREIFFKED